MPTNYASGASGARRAGVTYSQACALQLQTSATQTDLTWPIDSKLPIAAANLPLTKSTDTQSETEQTDDPFEEAVGGRHAPSARAMGSMNGAASAPPPSSSNKNVKNPHYTSPSASSPASRIKNTNNTTSSASSPASSIKTTNNPHYKPPPNAANQRPQQGTYTFANKRQTQKVRGVPVETFNRNG